MLDEWLAHEEPRLRNVTYNRYAGFLKQLFDIAKLAGNRRPAAGKSARLWENCPRLIMVSVA